jgi:hypothetical protein
VDEIEEFFQLARTITSVGIGTTIGINERLAITDHLLVKSISSILTVESRDDAFFRHIRGAEVLIPIFPRLAVSQLPSTQYTRSTESDDQTEFTWDPMQTLFFTEASKHLFVG